MIERPPSSRQNWVAIGAIGVAAIVFVGIIALIIASNAGYDRFGWTGFKGKTLWDWLGFLVALAIPVVVGFGVVWFTETQRKAERDQEKKAKERANEKVLLQELYSSIIQAYNGVKAVRRSLRATARNLSPGDEIMIMRALYSEQMQELIDIQLQFEASIDELGRTPTLLAEQLDTIKRNLRSIEKYLNDIIAEYENLYKMHPNATSTLPFSKLPKLGEFIGQYKDATDFRTKFQAPAHQVMGAMLNLLTSE